MIYLPSVWAFITEWRYKVRAAEILDDWLTNHDAVLRAQYHRLIKESRLLE